MTMADSIIPFPGTTAPTGPDKVQETRGQIFRAMSLVNLCQQTLLNIGAGGGLFDSTSALDLSNALEMAYEVLDDTTDSFDYFSERVKAVAHG
jgi:hypothetical protein